MTKSIWARSVASAFLLFIAQDGAVQAQTVVDRYCVSCHNARAKAGQLDLTSIDFTAPARHADVSQKVLAKLRAGLMPPAGQRRPGAAEQDSFVRFLETGLDQPALQSPNPARTEAFHRLNRTEYGNAVR